MRRPHDEPDTYQEAAEELEAILACAMDEEDFDARVAGATAVQFATDENWFEDNRTARVVEKDVAEARAAFVAELRERIPRQRGEEARWFEWQDANRRRLVVYLADGDRFHYEQIRLGGEWSRGYAERVPRAV